MHMTQLATLIIRESYRKESRRDLVAGGGYDSIRNARACGKQLGRPRRIVNRDEVSRLRSEGASLRQIAAKLGVGYGTVRLRLGSQ
jgi:DNA invertase Pin-like site-specific DNA recombinase